MTWEFVLKVLIDALILLCVCVHARCVMKMDHHCPLINNCVGHFNHAYFTCFLFFVPCGCIHSLFMLIPALYRAVYRVSDLITLWQYSERFYGDLLKLLLLLAD